MNFLNNKKNSLKNEIINFFLLAALYNLRRRRLTLRHGRGNHSIWSNPMIHSFLWFKFRLFGELFNEMQQFFLTKFYTHLHIHMFKARKRSVLLLSSADYSANWIRRQMESNEFKIPRDPSDGCDWLVESRDRRTRALAQVENVTKIVFECN